MNEPSNTPMGSGMPAMEPFYQTWIKALTKPNEQSYGEIAASAPPNTYLPYIWMFVSGIAGTLVSALVALVFPNSSPYGRSGIVTLLCVIPLGGIISVAAFAIGTGIIQWIAKLFGGTGSYNKLLYVVYNFAAPLGLVAGVLAGFSSIPTVGLCFSGISLLIGLYSLYLETLSVKVVNGLDWGKAAITVVAPVLIVVFLCACLFAVGFSAIMSQIQQ